MDRFDEIEKRIEDIVSRAPGKMDLVHAKFTKKWLLKLKPDADRAFQIAALAHDIDRGFITEEEERKNEDSSDYKNFKRKHCEKSADIISQELKKYGFEEKIIRRVKDLVENHEFGGDPDSNLLREADSISFFEVGLETFYLRFGEDHARDKIRFMYDRMSERGREIVRGFQYEHLRLVRLIEEILSAGGGG